MTGNINETIDDLNKRIWVHQTHARRDMHQRIIDLMDLYVRTVTTLDVGCGNGAFTRKIKQKVLGFGKVHAFDISPELIASAKITEPQYDINYFVHDANERLEFKNKTFDFITCIHAIYYFSNPEWSIKEFKRILKPGGIFIFTAPGRKNAPELLKLIETITGKYSEQAIERKVEDMIIPAAYKLFGNITVELFENPVIFIKPDLLMDYIRSTPYWRDLEPHQDKLLKEIEWWMKTYGNLTITKEVHIVKCQKMLEID